MEDMWKCGRPDRHQEAPALYVYIVSDVKSPTSAAVCVCVMYLYMLLQSSQMMMPSEVYSVTVTLMIGCHIRQGSTLEVLIFDLFLFFKWY